MAAEPSASEKRIAAFDLLRVLACICVVLAHSKSHVTFDTPAERLLLAATANGTVLFFFLGGYFFVATGAADVPNVAFLRHRAKRLVPPFLIACAFCTVIDHWFDQALGWQGMLHDLAVASVGGGNTHLWFIPIILLLSSSTLMLRKFHCLPMKAAVSLMVVLAANSFLIGRPNWPYGIGIDQLHLYLFALPYWLGGMVWARNQEMLVVWLNRALPALIAAYGLLVVYQVFVSGRVAMATSDPLYRSLAIDLSTPHKFLQLAIFLAVMNHASLGSVSWVRRLADAGFAIYLLHWWILNLFKQLQIPKTIVAWGVSELGVWIGMALAGFTLSYAIAAVLKRLLGRRARIVIGY